MPKQSRGCRLAVPTCETNTSADHRIGLLDAGGRVRPGLPKRVVSEIEALATSTDLSVRQIQSKIAGRASRGIVGEITKRARAPSSPLP